MEPATDTELLYNTLNLEALVRKYNRARQVREKTWRKRRHQCSVDPQQDKKMVEALFKLALCIIKLYIHQSSRANTLVDFDLIDHNPFLASQYRRNKKSGLRHTHLMIVFMEFWTSCTSHTLHQFIRGGGGGIWLLMLDGPNKSDCNLIPDAINER